MIVVSDTSPITNLAAISYLDLLQHLYGFIIIPIAVYDEMVRVDKIVPGALEVQNYSWIKTQKIINTQQVKALRESQENIDLGEAEAIILALELKADLLLMDERRGRAVASSYGLSLTGLLGVLVQAKKTGLIPAVKPLIEQLIKEADFRVSDKVYATILEFAKEL